MVLITPERFIRANQVKDTWGPNMVLYGPTGAGKTTMASTAQDSLLGKNVFFIDVEGGTRSISDRPDITLFKPQTWDEIQGVYTFLAQEKHDYRTIVVDSLTDAQRYSLEHALKGAKTPDLPGLQDFGKSNEQITRMVRAFKTLSQTKGFTIIFTALEKQDKDESTGAVHVGPALTPKAQEGVCSAVDCVARLSVNREGQRVLQLAPRGPIIAKFRSPRSGARLADEIINPTMPALLEALQGGKPVQVAA